MEVVINVCYGGFSLSPEATIELWKRGGPVDARPAVESFRGSYCGTYEQAIEKWRAYVNEGRDSFLLSVFSPDETLVLYAREVDRADPLLVAVVEEMGAKANGSCADLKVVEIPDGIEFFIDEYDGMEHVAEVHRTWS